MPSSRASANALARLLEAVASPLYVVDDERKIAFCNQACRDWTGLSAEQLLGQECRYHSGAAEAGPSAIAAALCPPPEAFRGRRASANIALPEREDGPSQSDFQRRADFVPLGSHPATANGVLAIVSAAGEGGETERATSEATPAELHARIQRQRRRLIARYHVDRLWGDSPAMRQVRAQVLLAAGGKGSVSVFGPVGSGREHVARAIHYGAGGKADPLVPLACPLLDSELLQATLRGLARAKSADAAQTPAVLLGDVDQLPPPAQLELAHALSGAAPPFRLLSTAREPLAEIAARGEFRHDLACLLSTLSIRLPPLVERLEDLPLAAQWFLEQVNSQGGKQVGGFSPEALDRLAAYSWPGDLAELEAFVAEAHSRCQASEVAPADLPQRIDLAAAAATFARRPEETIALEEFLAKIERELIERALKQARGNKTKAARLLSMTRPRFYRRLVQLGLAVEGEEEM